MPTWTAEQETDAFQMRGNGESAGKIGQIIGKSRRAVENFFIRQARRRGIPPAPSRKANNFFWNAERTAKVITLMAEGKTRNQAAAELCVTKNALTGIIDRLRVAGVKVPCRPPSIQLGLRRKRNSGFPLPKPLKTSRLLDMAPVTLALRTGCAFPVNEGNPFKFCNNPVTPGRPYCPFHGKVMVQLR